MPTNNAHSVCCVAGSLVREGAEVVLLTSEGERHALPPELHHELSTPAAYRIACVALVDGEPHGPVLHLAPALGGEVESLLAERESRVRHELGSVVDEGLSVIERHVETLNPEDAYKVEQALLALRHKSEHWARTCTACGGCVHEMYMVREEVWLSIMPTYEGHLHLACLEKKLGRFLTIDDFPSSAANVTLLFGHRLKL